MPFENWSRFIEETKERLKNSSKDTTSTAAGLPDKGQDRRRKHGRKSKRGAQGIQKGIKSHGRKEEKDRCSLTDAGKERNVMECAGCSNACV